jgi:membrane fusion protein (multidrug efflux system)
MLNFRNPTWSVTRLGTLVGLVAALAGCGNKPPTPLTVPLEVTLLTVVPTDSPVSAEYVAQTQSSQLVNIQARVSGFLDKRIYTEGAVVKTGQVLFQMDPKPFQVQVDAAVAVVQRNQAALQVATASLKRTKPLVQQNALSQKDLDDAQGQYEQSEAAVAQSQAQLETARLNLSYTTITSPVDGITSSAAITDGTYLSPQNSQLTTVSVITPIWVNFSLSENQVQRLENETKAGRIRLPKDRNMTVEIERSDGSLYPFTGKITFANPSYNTQTGTFLLRATVDNPDGQLRPNQYVRVRLLGAVRPNAILVPQRAVQQGAKGHFVWLIDDAGKAEVRPIIVGEWQRDNWFVNDGLNAGEKVVVDGAQRLYQGATVQVMPAASKAAAAPAAGS